ncbi:MAG TPA: hypothetical protein VK533_01260 [Sphingomonas sp.]|uniref:hypothetical protein n=1 Tax=Sphingomonas sp. TaxID=28214 RepID=UPI002C81FCB4|nr:hypothetical protein [Sphingomonas sp.]HMI18149.1 hypothetical protein [Sphingomonas sp.]
MRRGLIFFCSITLAGCAADPSVRYVEATSPAAVATASPHLIDSFYLQKNDVHIALHNSAAEGKPPVNDLVVTDTRAEEATHRLMILRDDSAWTKTTISLAKVENSDLIESAGVAVEDQRLTLIQTIGNAAKTVLPLLVGASASEIKPEDQPIPSCEHFPREACDLPQPGALGIGAAAGHQGPKGWFQALWGPVPPSAIPVADFLAGLGTRHVHGLYYASCRSLEIRFAGDGPPSDEGPPTITRYDWKGKVADPRWVEFVRFPRKGNIRMHSQCGVSITSEADPTQSTAALLNEALNQAAAVKAAVDAPH